MLYVDYTVIKTQTSRSLILWGVKKPILGWKRSLCLLGAKWQHIALMNTHCGTMKKAKLLFYHQVIHLPKHRQYSLVPTSSLPAQGYLALITVFPPSLSFLSAEPRARICVILSLSSAASLGWLPIMSGLCEL